SPVRAYHSGHSIGPAGAGNRASRIVAHIVPSVCGIVRPSRSGQDSQLDAMLRSVSHYEWLEAQKHTQPADGVALGVVTLNSVDKADALYSPDGRSVVVLDGEIYNAAAERRR